MLPAVSRRGLLGGQGARLLLPELLVCHTATQPHSAPSGVRVGCSLPRTSRAATRRGRRRDQHHAELRFRERDSLYTVQRLKPRKIKTGLVPGPYG